ncbi:radical SAM family heme chaperone HemW [Olivibacter domesticus]|uniref:Heme chaperone HemW n=1 Tax=Olivibacter domesticus TaxID=407022 RepID=A0A1H7TQW6_OLID1|nr:radical SAM family heme chaperone HemW [Olivibacter domesticus]SEL87078.1 oxygen-independent coproporphyrinogen-3 oxidase [Olivibacter domesticus]
MAGVYFHIPFCKQACHYCDFHFSTSFKHKDEMLQAMLQEINLQANYLENEEIETLYFGGGTPSLLETDDINALIDEIAKRHTIKDNAEITLEANPDDLHIKKVKELRETPINRFSIGVQSFYEEDLVWMNRAHSASEADSSIKRVQDAGFENITADLIYGFPLLTDVKWKANIDKLLAYNIPHISAYSMTVEAKTALAHFIKSGKQKAMNEEQSANQFYILSDILTNAGFEHYEISNYARPQSYAVHNTNYWKSRPYLGIGPSAHSFNGKQRQWNINNNAQYISSLLKQIIPAEIENLTLYDKINEYIMTSLRTMWGMDLSLVERQYGDDYKRKIVKKIASFEDANQAILNNGTITLTFNGKLVADQIAADLFFDEE